MKQRAHDLDDMLEGVRASLGAGARSLSVTAMLTWRLIRIGVATDDQLFALTEDLGSIRRGPCAVGRSGSVRRRGG